MLALLQQTGNQVPGLLQIAVALSVVAQSAAIIAGIIAAWYRFVREKPHAFRLQPTVSGTHEIRGTTIYLAAKATIHNTGQVDIPLDLERSGLRIETKWAGDEEWRLFRTRNIFLFLEDAPLRPDVKIEDQLWEEIPHDGRVAARLELTIVPQSETEPFWTTASIVNLVTEKGAISSDNG